MPVAIVIPNVGESITEGTLARWLRKNGDIVREGDPLFELETEKATSEVPAPASGRLTIVTPDGETVVVGATVGQLDVATASTDAVPKAAAPVEAPPQSRLPVQPVSAPAPPPQTHAEFQRATQTRSTPASIVAKDDGQAISRTPMTRLRKTIAERLVAAQKNAAILTTFNEADMTQVMETRRQLKEQFKEAYGVSLGFMPFFLRASVEALRAYPLVNAMIEGDEIVQHHRYHIGVAVSTERGLVVPVIRDADRKSFADLETEVAEFARKAREGKIALSDLQGGTFTITNGGVFGSLLSTPLLNPPQTAILGMHAIQKRPVVIDDEIKIRPMMYLAVSYDHRLLDGREAVLFLVRIKELIERPERLLLGL